MTDSTDFDRSLQRLKIACLLPSLEHKAGVKIVVSLWTDSDLKETIDRYAASSGTKYFTLHSTNDSIVESLLTRVSKLPIPKCMQVSLEKFFNPITAILFQWIAYQDTHIFQVNAPEEGKSRASQYVKCISWNPRGTINYEQSAGNLLAREDISVFEKYKIACHYCLEKEADKYEPMVTELEKERVFCDPDVEAWYSFRKGRSLLSVFQLVGCRDALCKYFWKHYSDKEKISYIHIFLKGPCDVETMWYYLLNMNAVQQNEAICRNANEVVNKMKCHPLWLDECELSSIVLRDYMCVRLTGADLVNLCVINALNNFYG